MNFTDWSNYKYMHYKSIQRDYWKSLSYSTVEKKIIRKLDVWDIWTTEYKQDNQLNAVLKVLKTMHTI